MEAAARMETKAPPPFGTFGFKLQVFTNFINDCGGEDAFMKRPLVKEPLTCYDVCHKFIKPQTLHAECTYLEYFTESARGSPHVGEAQVYVCHAWSDLFLETVHSLRHHFNDKPDTFIWFDLFCNNQHTLPEKSLPEAYHISFARTLKKIASTSAVIIMNHWDNPQVLKRTWCQYEMFCTIVNEKNLEVCVAPPMVSAADTEVAAINADADSNSNENIESLLRELITDPEPYVRKLKEYLRIEKSESFKKEDKVRIVSDIVQPLVGLTKFNKTLTNEVLKRLVLGFLDKKINADVAKISSGKIGLLAQVPLKELIWDSNLAKACILCHIRNEKGHLRTDEALKLCLKIIDQNNEDQKSNTKDGAAKAKIRMKLGDENRWYRTFMCIAEVYFKLHIESGGGGGDDAEQTAYLDDALEYYEKSLDILMAKNGGVDTGTGPASCAIGSLYEKMACVYREQQDYEKALSYLEKDLVIQNRVLGAEDHPKITEMYNIIGTVHIAMSHYSDAMKYFGRALKLGVRPLLGDYDSVAESYSGIAATYFAQKEYSQSLKFLMKAISVQYEVLGKDADSADIATTLFNIANIHYCTANYQEALEKYETSRAIRANVYGEDHHSVLDCYRGLAATYTAQGNCIQSLETYRVLLQKQRESIGDDHAQVAETYNSAAAVHYMLNNFNLSLENFELALVIEKRCQGKEHIAVGNTLYNIATIHYQSSNHKKALETHMLALPIKQKSLGKIHPSVANSLHQCGNCHFSLSNNSDGMDYYRRALVVREQVLPADHPDIAQSFNAIALIYDKQADYRQAMDYFEKARAIQKGASVPEQTPRVNLVMNPSIVMRKAAVKRGGS